MTLANLPYKAPFIKHFDVGISYPKPPKRWVFPNFFTAAALAERSLRARARGTKNRRCVRCAVTWAAGRQ